MTAALELFLRGLFAPSHVHRFERFDIAMLAHVCQCGERVYAYEIGEPIVMRIR